MCKKFSTYTWSFDTHSISPGKRWLRKLAPIDLVNNFMKEVQSSKAQLESKNTIIMLFICVIILKEKFTLLIKEARSVSQ